MRFFAPFVITSCAVALLACSPTSSGSVPARIFPGHAPVHQNKAFSQSAQGESFPKGGSSERDAVQQETEKDRPFQNLKALVEALPDEVLAAQVLLSGVDGKGRPSAAMEALLREIPVGGVMLFRYNIGPTASAMAQYNATLRELLRRRYEISSSREKNNREVAILFPFIAIDHEGGSVDRLYPLTGFFPAPGRYAIEQGLFPGRPPLSADAVQRSLDAVASAAYKAGKDLASLGFTLNLAPLAEPLSAENAPFVGDRSFGSDPVFVAAAAAAFVGGMERAGIASVAKHFPHSSAVDPHEDVATLDAPLSELSRWILPFQRLAVMEGGPSAIMVSHSMITTLDAHRPASLSLIVIQRWLKEKLDYQGIAMADDFAMGAIAKTGKTPETAVVEALAAGIDMVMVWPPDLRRVHRAILGALRDGQLARPRLEDAVQRILMQKARYGLLWQEAVPFSQEVPGEKKN